MPTNVYGLNDNFDKTNGHVIPSMITKFIEAKIRKKSFKIIGYRKTFKGIHSY